MSEHFQLAEDALSYIALHDDHAKRLNRASMPTLRGQLGTARHEARVQMVMEGTLSKDELIAEILALRYPLIAEARQVHREKSMAAAEAYQAELDAQHAAVHGERA